MTKPNAIQQYVRDHEKTILAFAVRKYDENEFLNSIQLVISQSEILQKTMLTPKGKASMHHALKLAAHTGLSLNPQMGEAALAVFKGEITYMTMKNGLIKLAMESGNVDFLTSDTIRENDKFSQSKTMAGDDYTFKPASTNRGKIIGFFAGMRMQDGSSHTKYLTYEEAMEHGQKYSFSFNEKNKPWQKSPEGMGLKTVIKALFRNQYISDVVKTAVGVDDYQEAINVGSARIEDLKGSTPEEINERLKEDESESESESEVENDPIF
ncbi:recombinase RecT [Candidatus Pacearchaeota archaeon]|nr:recombinase RecT [Candidatus Pacearchaeota archaeon]